MNSIDPVADYPAHELRIFQHHPSVHPASLRLPWRLVLLLQFCCLWSCHFSIPPSSSCLLNHPLRCHVLTPEGWVVGVFVGEVLGRFVGWVVGASVGEVLGDCNVGEAMTGAGAGVRSREEGHTRVTKH